MWEGLLDFFFPRRLGRLNYFVRVVLWNIPTYPLAQSFAIDDPVSMGARHLILLSLLLLYACVFIFLPRVRDSGMPQWSMVCIFIPIVNHLYSILLTFRRSWTPIDESRAHPSPDESQIYMPHASGGDDGTGAGVDVMPPER